MYVSKGFKCRPLNEDLNGVNCPLKQNKKVGFETDKFILLVVKFFISTMCH